MVRTAEVMQAEAIRDAPPPRDPLAHDFEPEVAVNQDDTAKTKADQPQLTGHDEWDAVELAETDPSREPIPREFLEGLI